MVTGEVTATRCDDSAIRRSGGRALIRCLLLIVACVSLGFSVQPASHLAGVVWAQAESTSSLDDPSKEAHFVGLDASTLALLREAAREGRELHMAFPVTPELGATYTRLGYALVPATLRPLVLLPGESWTAALVRRHPARGSWILDMGPVLPDAWTQHAKVVRLMPYGRILEVPE